MEASLGKAMQSRNLNDREKVLMQGALWSFTYKCSCHWHFPALKTLEGLALVRDHSGMGVPHGPYSALERDISETVDTACPAQCEIWLCFIWPWLVRGKFSAWMYWADADEMQMVEKKWWWWWPSSLSYLLLFDKAELTVPKEKIWSELV